ncbi:MAG: methionyl-tRNA formyltransferase [Gemmatimonadota bacterium]
MRILFWGTPEFAVPSLRALAEEGHALVAVVTQPDKPAGRGRKLQASPVKLLAEEEEIPVLQPVRASEPDFVAQIEALAPDISIVVAYGQILSDEVLSAPRLGTFNVHASLLPELRGAAPINWAIIQGHSHTGVSIIRLVRELDAGPVLEAVSAELPPDMVAGELATILAELGALALINNLAQLEMGQANEQEQDHERATYAPKLSRDIVRVDWNRSAEEIGRWLRGCDPRPGAWTELEGAPIQLFAPRIEDGGEEPSAEPANAAAGQANAAAEPGTVLEADPKSGLLVATGAGALHVGEVRPAGKPRMAATAWISGRGVEAGQVFE